MNKWQEFLNEPMSKPYTSRVMEAAQAEMAKGAVARPSIFARAGIRWSFAAGFVALAAAFFINAQHNARPHGQDIDLMAHEDEMLKDADFFSELDTLEAWDELEANGSPDST